SFPVVVLSIATLATVGAQDFYMHVTQVDHRTVGLVIEKSNQPDDIAFVDAQGMILYSYSSKAVQTSIEGYNSKDLPDATYYITLESETKVERIQVVFSERETVIKSDKKEITYKPHIRSDGDVVSVNLLNMDESVVGFKVYDQTTNS